VTGAAWLAVALLVAAVPIASSCSLAVSTAFLTEFLSEGRVRPLSAVTPAPSRGDLPATVQGRPIPADLYRTAALARPPGLVLVHGLSPRGKDDPRLVQAAQLLARAGFAVGVPTIDGLTTLRLRPEDAAAVRGSVDALWQLGHRPVAVLAVSVGAGPAFLGTADRGDKVSAVLALGGYGSTVELLRYTLTGAYRYEDVAGRRPVDDAAVALFARANAELVDEAGRALVDNRDPEALDRLVAALRPETRRMLEDLSPQHAVARLRAPLFLVHGRGDPAVPFTESLRLAEAARAAGVPARVVIVGAVGHVEAGERAGAGDLARRAAVFHAFREAAFAAGAGDGAEPASTSGGRAP
jgi:pimeloyl-ACP methyl ester carboxylesterase